MLEILKRHQNIWKNKKILRTIYFQWYVKIVKELYIGKNKTLEIGSGSGNFKEFKPDIISSDIIECDWLDFCFDAHSLPFQDGSLSNIVMIDVFHHLSNPMIFLNEAYRVLESGGKIIMIEPFPSPFSLLVYKLFHPEPFIMNFNCFNNDKVVPKDPLTANQALPYLFFFKKAEEFKKIFKNKFKIIKKEKISFLLYPLSGGFEHHSLIPEFLIPFFIFLEKILMPLRNLMSFRCFVVLKKNS